MRIRTAGIVGLLLVSLPAGGQDEPLPELFSDVIDVRVVNVEVVVTDRKGNRIRGLEPGDFELRVDGEPVPIDYFAEIDDGLAKTSSDLTVGNVPSLTPNEPVGTNYLIFIDDLHAIQQRRNRVLKRLRQDLSLLGPADQVAVVAFDGRDLTRITDWTRSGEEIQEALLQAERRKALGLLNTSGLGYRTRRSVMAAAGTLRSFADTPGRKVMLLLIAEWDNRGIVWNPQWGWSQSRRASLRTLYGPLIHAANQVGYSLYPIDLPGLGGRSVGTSEGRFHNVLRVLAEQTGGLPMINSFSKKALAETAEDTSSYYWLGFEPPGNEDGRLHDIAVQLPGHGSLRVRTRAHYLDMSRTAEIGMLLEGALLFGGTPGTESLDVSFGEPRRAGFRRLHVPMEVTVPLDDVDLMPMNGLWVNDLEFRIRLINKWGDQAVPPAARVQVRIPNEPRPADVLVFGTVLEIRKRDHRFVAAVYDPLTGELLSTKGTVGPATATGTPNGSTE